MSGFDSDAFEPVLPTDVGSTVGVEVVSQERPRPAFFLVLASMCAGIFMPWIVLRIPGRAVQEISLFRMVGGTPMVFAFFFFASSGILMWMLKVRFGVALTSLPWLFWSDLYIIQNTKTKILFSLFRFSMSSTS